MATTDSKAPLRTVKRVQFGILAPDEIVINLLSNIGNASPNEIHF